MARKKIDAETESKLFDVEIKIRKAALTARVLSTGLCGELERLTHNTEPYMPRATEWQAVKDVFNTLDRTITEGINNEAYFYKLRSDAFVPLRNRVPRDKAVPRRTRRKAVITKKD